MKSTQRGEHTCQVCQVEFGKIVKLMSGHVFFSYFLMKRPSIQGSCSDIFSLPKTWIVLKVDLFGKLEEKLIEGFFFCELRD